MQLTSTYQCKEIDLDGKLLSTNYRAESKEEVVQMIRSKGHTPVKIGVEETKGQDLADLSFFQPKVKVKDVAIFCKQLHTMLHAGMPLITALDVLMNQTENKTIRATVKDMVNMVQKGEILSTAMKRHKKVFPSLLVSMVEAGEMTGNLDSVLERMSEHYVKENKINSKIKGAMMYPMILSILAVGVVTFLLVFIMPTFVGMFQSSGVALPLPTRILMGISEILQAYWYIVIAVVAGIGFALKQLVSTPSGKLFFDQLKLKLPVIGPSVAKIATSRFTRTLSTLLASGISLIQGLETAAFVSGNQVVINGVGRMIEDIKKGASISSRLKSVGIFPPMMISMVSIGEESGSLEEMLEKTADFYDEELESAISRMVSVIEPLMIVVMALLIGFIVIAMMMPMFDMMNTVQ